TAPATTQLYPLSLHDALPISGIANGAAVGRTPPWHGSPAPQATAEGADTPCGETGMNCLRTRQDQPTRTRKAHDPSRSKAPTRRSEEHTSELQSRFDLVCRLL